MKISKPILLSITTTGFLVLGYFGVQHFGRNAMFITAASVGSAGAISYVIQKPSEQKPPSSDPEPTIAPIKTVGQRKTKKSSTEV
ncbi:hypothetical protein [Nostoc sp. NMS4]|uniref:hypothetical protein n=1 Tax=Nostoc sp. NMS4 TaxID=2815390 RepID=UPI0025FE1F19|nr:hypothetical protein [Nostoc sp. NMS4]MBN3927178.1 hypothetical protein [Nostoc sp. NMS4]